MLLANGQVGLHEQIRLQPYIAGSIDAPLRDALYVALDELGQSLPHHVAHAVHALASRLFHPVADAASRLWEEFATRELMTLSLPDGELLLGESLPAPQGAPLYPPVLDPIDGAETIELLDQYGADRPGRTSPALSTGHVSPTGCATSSTCSAHVSATRRWSASPSRTSSGPRSSRGWRYRGARVLLVLEQLVVGHVAEHARRVADDDHARRHVLRHDRAGADERLLADLDPRAEDRAAADARAAADRRALRSARAAARCGP